jgi:lipopolysaccharide/colanic/teichoic acid biosynthesis glycosyltransferase
MQRFFDILFCTSALFLLSPILIVILGVLSVTGERELFYWQSRVGRHGRIFQLVKFATMLKKSPNIGTGTITVQNDPRVLPFGKLLRKTKLNELPQLYNVIIGDMSLIGPRPLTEENFEAYDHNTKKNIMMMRPGLSGAGSIIFRDEESLVGLGANTKEIYFLLIAPYKGSLECWYAKNLSLKLYFTLIFLTLISVMWPSSNLFWRFCPSAPKPPSALKDKLNYKMGKN